MVMNREIMTKAFGIQSVLAECGDRPLLYATGSPASATVQGHAFAVFRVFAQKGCRSMCQMECTDCVHAGFPLVSRQVGGSYNIFVIAARR